MKNIAIFIAIALLFAGGQVYACCGGATWSQYESVSESSGGYIAAQDAAKEYLKIKAADGELFNTRGQSVTVDASRTDSEGIQGPYGIAGQSFATERLIAIVFMYDSDANGQTSIGDAGSNWGGHKLCTIAGNCHLNQSSQQAAQAAHSSCSHHACHWDYIKPQLDVYKVSQKPGS